MEADAERLPELARAHWAIENGLHYRRDVTFKEDSCRMQSHTAAEALAVCNNLALGLIRHAGWNNVAEARRFYDAHPAQGGCQTDCVNGNNQFTLFQERNDDANYTPTPG